MAIRVKFNIDLSLSETTTEAKELGATPPWTGCNDQQDDGGTFRRRIPAGSTDVEVDINGLTAARLLAIKSNQEVTVKKNSDSGEAWTIRPLGVGALDGVFVVTTDGITSLFFSNAGALDAEVTIAMAGII